MNKALPESIQDVIKLKNETQPVKEVLYNFCCCQGGSTGGSSDQVEVQYSMLNQSDKDVFGKENFDNVNFDYDDFNSSSGLLANWNEIFLSAFKFFGSLLIISNVNLKRHQHYSTRQSHCKFGWREKLLSTPYFTS